MKNGRKKTIAIILLILVLLLGGVGIYISYQLQGAAVPTAPTSIPRAAEWYGASTCNVNFTVAGATGTPTAAPNPCNGDCGSDSNCQTGLTCYNTGVEGKRCRNPQYPTSATCLAPTAAPTTTATSTPPTVVTTATPTAMAVATATPTPTPTGEILYETGVLNLPGAAAFGGGLLLTVLGILFAL